MLRVGHTCWHGIRKGAPTKMEWERVDVLRYIGLREYLNAKRSDVLFVNGRNFRIITKGLIRLTAHGVYCQKDCS